MSLQTVERAILAELKVVAKNPKLKQKNIMEWSTGKIHPQEGEKEYYLPVLGIHVCVLE